MARYKKALPKLPARGYFKKGDKGEEVKKLQRGLNWANSGTIRTPLVIDGEVGDKTIAEVVFFEMLHDKAVDGEFGKVCREKLRTLNLTGRIRACSWALSVALDNTFAYGSGERAHRNGCYFCGTNIGPNAKNKERKGEPHVVKDSKGNGHTYKKTYCCNTFITAAYAHGTGDKAILKICKSCDSCWGLKDWMKSYHFRKKGTCKSFDYEKLWWGDVIITDTHVWMYIGNGRIIEASGNNWSHKSIAMKDGAKKRYDQNKKEHGVVMRWVE